MPPAIGLTWDALADLQDEALERRLYGPKVTGTLAVLAQRHGKVWASPST